MKKYILGTISFLLLILVSCEKDNYDEPQSNLIGRIISAGAKEAIGVRETEGAVQVQLWQDGYELYTPIAVYVNQDGTFAAKLFDGTYKLVTRDNNGPWVNKRDTVVINVKGNTSVEYIVNPYYILKNENFNVNGKTLTVTFDIDEVTAGKSIERITLYVNSTRFVDSSFKVKSTDATSPTVGTNIITMDLSTLSNPVLYARIGVKITNVDQMLYTAGSIKVK